LASNGLAYSYEAPANVVVTARNDYLGRAGDPSGLACWTSMLMLGTTDETTIKLLNG
jgi:hypothetical protein